MRRKTLRRNERRRAIPLSMMPNLNNFINPFLQLLFAKTTSRTITKDKQQHKKNLKKGFYCPLSVLIPCAGRDASYKAILQLIPLTDKFVPFNMN